MNSSQMSVASEYRGLAKAQKVEPSNAGMEGFMSAKVLVEGCAARTGAHTREAGGGAGRPARLRSRRHPDQLQPDAHTGSSFVEMSIVSSTGKLIR
jgi:hypothetical protein